jgi:ABC-type Fe3+-siderophore transport system permease subunit
MGKSWQVVVAAVLLGWVILSMYFLASGAPLVLPNWLEPYLPYIGVAVFAVAIFVSYRRPMGVTPSRYALPAAVSGAILAALFGMTLVNWDNGSQTGMRWLLGTIAWAPIAGVLFVLWRRDSRR